TLYKAVIRTPLNILEVLQVTRIGQLVQINNLIFRVAINHPSQHMRADKSGAAGNDNFLHFINFQKDYDRADKLPMPRLNASFLPHPIQLSSPTAQLT